MFKKKDEAAKALISQIHSIAGSLKKANGALACCQDPLLLESTIYEIKYLETRYAYLLKKARENNISVQKF